MIQNPWLAGVITLLTSLIWMRVNNVFAKKGIVSSSTSRKIIHIGTGPLFVICWLLFPDEKISKYIAAFVPFLIVAQLGLVGLGIIKDDSSIKAMARSGVKSELLKGPFFYGVVFVLVTVFFWKSVHAIIALMILCGGDGMADLIGTRYGYRKLPWNKSKSIIGSIAMVLFGFILSLGLIICFWNSLNLQISVPVLCVSLLGISFFSALIESITPSEFDNLTVPVAALVSSIIIF